MECSISSVGCAQAKTDGPARTHMENLKFAVGRTIGKVLSSVNTRLAIHSGQYKCWRKKPVKPRKEPPTQKKLLASFLTYLHWPNLRPCRERWDGIDSILLQYTHIVKGYSSVEKKSPGTLKTIHEDMIRKLSENLKMEIDQMFEEENIQSYMEGLDKLKSCVRDLEKVTWRTSCNPEEDILASIDPKKEKQLVEMEKLLHDLESENMLLKGAVKSRQNLLLETKDKVDRHMEKLRRVVEVEKMIPTEHFIDFVNQYTER